MKNTTIILMLLSFWLVSCSSSVGNDSPPDAELPDLVVENLVWEPLNPDTGEEVTFTCTIGNQGSVAVDEFEVEVSGAVEDNRTLQNLGAGVNTSYSFTP